MSVYKNSVKEMTEKNLRNYSMRRALLDQRSTSAYICPHITALIEKFQEIMEWECVDGENFGESWGWI